MTASFHIPPVLMIGGGSSGELAEHLLDLKIERVLLVTDSFIRKSGLIQRFQEMLKNAGIDVTVFDGVQPDPTVDNVREGLEVYRSFHAQGIVAVGGGSPIDAAKAISILTTNPEPLSQYAGYHKIPESGAPVIAIPTTAGTGSEATKVAVISDTERNVKMMMLDRHLLPVAALVDYELSLTMPQALTAHVGIDTLTHGIEAYVSRKAQGMTDPLALSCIRLCAKHLANAWEFPDDRTAREGMMLAACQGGMAFANSSVCLVHGMSRPLGAIFHIPHGLSNAVLLPAVVRYSISGAPDRYAKIAREMGFCEPNTSISNANDALLDGLERLNNHLKIPRIRDLNEITSNQFEPNLSKMAADALASGSPQNNPVIPSAEDVISLYKRAW